MLIGSKPLADMTEEEMLQAIEELQSAREALRSDAIKASKERAPKAPKAPKTDAVIDGILADFLGGGK